MPGQTQFERARRANEMEALRQTESTRALFQELRRSMRPFSINSIVPTASGGSGGSGTVSWGSALQQENEITQTRQDKIKQVMKVRHLNRDERHSLHMPKSDWCESKRGEICKSACTLDVDDLVGVSKTKKTIKKIVNKVSNTVQDIPSMVR